jgi:hypothetical protein
MSAVLVARPAPAGIGSSDLAGWPIIRKGIFGSLHRDSEPS